jgi:hypothetical protein
MGWTWYLANDFQFFLMVPIIVQLFVRGRRLGREATNNGTFYPISAFALQWAPVVLLVITQAVSHIVTFKHMNILTSTSLNPVYSRNIYDRPWTRVTPYAFGIGMAFFHICRVERCANRAQAEEARTSFENDEADRAEVSKLKHAWRKIFGVRLIYDSLRYMINFILLTTNFSR